MNNTLVHPQTRLANKEISQMFINSILIAPILEKYKNNKRIFRHIFMNAIILPIVKDQETLCVQEKGKRVETILEFSHNDQTLTMNISCYNSDDRKKITTCLKIDYTNNNKITENIVRNTQDYAEYCFTDSFVFSQYPHILIDQGTQFSKIMHNISPLGKTTIENFINALFAENIKNRPKVKITTHPVLSEQFTNYIKHVKFSSTGGITPELWDIITGTGGASKQTKYKKTNQIIAYKNKSYCLYTGIKGGNYIRVKHNGTFIFKYIKPT